MKKTVMLAIVASSIGLPASASSPEAWNQLNARVDRACLLASGLKRAKVSADKASFDDRLPIELRVIEGYNRQSVIDVKLCAYDRRTRRAILTEAVGRLGVNRR